MRTVSTCASVRLPRLMVKTCAKRNTSRCTSICMARFPLLHRRPQAGAALLPDLSKRDQRVYQFICAKAERVCGGQAQTRLDIGQIGARLGFGHVLGVDREANHLTG